MRDSALKLTLNFHEDVAASPRRRRRDRASVDASREGSFATPSSRAGGIGLSVHNIRATDSYIRGSNGTSNGIVPMLRVYNDTARYVDQGGGKRKVLTQRRK